jgi:hypothetical protein
VTGQCEIYTYLNTHTYIGLHIHIHIYNKKQTRKPTLPLKHKNIYFILVYTL